MQQYSISNFFLFLNFLESDMRYDSCTEVCEYFTISQICVSICRVKKRSKQNFFLKIQDEGKQYCNINYGCHFESKSFRYTQVEFSTNLLRFPVREKKKCRLAVANFVVLNSDAKIKYSPYPLLEIVYIFFKTFPCSIHRNLVLILETNHNLSLTCNESTTTE